MNDKIDKKPFIFSVLGLLIPILGVPFSIIALKKADKLVDKNRHWSYIMAMILGALGIMMSFSSALAVVKALLT